MLQKSWARHTLDRKHKALLYVCVHYKISMCVADLVYSDFT